MAAKPGKKFCVEHGVVTQPQDDSGGDAHRTPCPYDPKHTCYLSKLNKHLRKCNSRPRQLPEYIAPGINAQDAAHPDAPNALAPIASVPENVLLSLVRKIERAFAQVPTCRRSCLSHPVVESALANQQLGANAKKHLIQNSSLLKNMEENGFFQSGATFVEFGAGRGQLGFWITRAVEDGENCSLLLIDRASHRHKSDNKLKGVSPVNALRIRADIADVDLSRVSLLSNARNVYGVTKHLCGLATDLALRCVVNGKSNGLAVRGVALAFCCHHRCTWRSFVGKRFLLESGFAPEEFPMLCGITSWAICGSGKSRSRAASGVAQDERRNSDRYGQMGLGQEVRESVGRKCKMILNHARLKYLEEFGFAGELVYYVDESVSPENVCLIARCEDPEGRA